MQKSFDSKIQELMQNHPDLFPTEAAFWAWLRGCLRRGIWEKSPMKFRYKKNSVSPPPSDYQGRAKKGQYCALDGEWIPTSKLEVDHIKGNKPLRSPADILPYIEHLLADKDELQLVSKDAHKIKSYADKQGISFEDARIAKQVIAIQNNKEDKEFIAKHGREPESNATKRKEQVKDILREAQNQS